MHSLHTDSTTVTKGPVSLRTVKVWTVHYESVNQKVGDKKARQSVLIS